jgi:adenosylhomocysteine nucleosidase
MLLIAAALGEELDVPLRLFPVRSKSKSGGITIRSAAGSGGTILFVKTGIGPGRSAHRIDKVLQQVRPSKILIIGYAGALDGRLKVGDIFIARKAMTLLPQGHKDPPLSSPETGGAELQLWPELHSAGSAAGLEINLGDLLTSDHVVGDPKQKILLFHQFRAQAVDMETAAIAAVAAAHGIPIGCVRAISDTAQDSFLAPFAGQPAAGFLTRASKLASAANWVDGYRDWREHAALARRSLHLFLSAYLQPVWGGPPAGGAGKAL